MSIANERKDLLLKVEGSRGKRPSQTILMITVVFSIEMVLIWTVQLPDWLEQRSSWPFLGLLAFAMGLLIIQGQSEKNERLLLDFLKREANEPITADISNESNSI